MSETSPVGGEPAAELAADTSQRGPERLVALDVLRVAIIVMVIIHHAAQAYGPTGGAWPVHDAARSDWFRPFYTVNAAVGLGLLFLLAGYFVPGSCDRKGAKRFLKERWARIGVPLVTFALAVNLPIVYLFGSRPPLVEFVRSLYDSGWQGVYLHLWFLGDLLLYSGVYVAWRTLRGRRSRPYRMWPAPSNGAIVGFVVALSLVTWIVRWWYPVDTWVPLLFVVPAEPAHLPQYVSLFTLGVVAYRGDWLRRIPTAVGLTWLAVGVAASAGVFAVEATGRWNDVIANGGLNWPSLVRSAWEAVICAGLAVGLIVLFRQVFRGAYRFLAAMATSSYAAYIVHLYIVVAVQGAIEPVELPALVKFALVAVLGVVLAFGSGQLSRSAPALGVILGTAATKGPRTPGRHSPSSPAHSPR
jgi:glucan biosynthesis protein C